MPRVTLLSACLPLLLGACRTLVQTQSSAPHDAVVTRAEVESAWEAWDDGRKLGSVVLYRDPATPAKGLYGVRNREQQTLGLIDFEGRAWRYRPHQPEPEWLGTGTVLEGVRRILHASSLIELRAVEPASLGRAP